MTTSKKYLPARVEFVIVFVILGGLIAVLYPAVQSVRNPKGPSGEIIPTQPPDEANRIHHSSGLSIVAPKNWDRARDFASDIPFLSIAARGAPGRRLKSGITIQRSDDFSDQLLNGFQKTTFHGDTAYEHMTIKRKDTFDDAGWSNWEMYVDHQGAWWMIRYDIADEMTTLPDQIRKYIDTIRLPGREGA